MTFQGERANDLILVPVETSGDLITMSVRPMATVSEFKSQIDDRLGLNIGIDNMCLLEGGKQLVNSQTLAELNVSCQTQLRLVTQSGSTVSDRQRVSLTSENDLSGSRRPAPAPASRISVSYGMGPQSTNISPGDGRMITSSPAVRESPPRYAQASPLPVSRHTRPQSVAPVSSEGHCAFADSEEMREIEAMFHDLATCDEDIFAKPHENTPMESPSPQTQNRNTAGDESARGYQPLSHPNTVGVPHDDSRFTRIRLEGEAMNERSAEMSAAISTYTSKTAGGHAQSTTSTISVSNSTETPSLRMNAGRSLNSQSELSHDRTTPILSNSSMAIPSSSGSTRDVTSSVSRPSSSMRNSLVSTHSEGISTVPDQSPRNATSSVRRLTNPMNDSASIRSGNISSVLGDPSHLISSAPNQSTRGVASSIRRSSNAMNDSVSRRSGGASSVLGDPSHVVSSAPNQSTRGVASSVDRSSTLGNSGPKIGHIQQRDPTSQTIHDVVVDIDPENVGHRDLFGKKLSNEPRYLSDIGEVDGSETGTESVLGEDRGGLTGLYQRAMEEVMTKPQYVRDGWEEMAGASLRLLKLDPGMAQEMAIAGNPLVYAHPGLEGHFRDAFPLTVRMMQDPSMLPLLVDPATSLRASRDIMRQQAVAGYPNGLPGQPAVPAQSITGGTASSIGGLSTMLPRTANPDARGELVQETMEEKNFRMVMERSHDPSVQNQLLEFFESDDYINGIVGERPWLAECPNLLEYIRTSSVDGFKRTFKMRESQVSALMSGPDDPPSPPLVVKRIDAPTLTLRLPSNQEETTSTERSVTRSSARDQEGGQHHVNEPVKIPDDEINHNSVRPTGEHENQIGVTQEDLSEGRIMLPLGTDGDPGSERGRHMQDAIALSLDRLLSMGFVDQEMNVQVLIACKGDFNKTLNALIALQE